ncbi:hypothetical protein GE061_018650 [Apolygus lucorum]|uniref:Uncharacterized protein n=1 Tax=Apolygus lucorum TaxID=248454 RepID=A0A6A4JCZ0_APOLU|nr:hypothetical protein GE061_018650 [Apolygus lucorum]
MAEMLTHTLLVELILFLIGTPFGSTSEMLGEEEGNSLIPPQFAAPPGEGLEYVDYVIPLVRRNDFFLKAAKSVPRIGRRNDFFYAKIHKSVPRIGG